MNKYSNYIYLALGEQGDYEIPANTIRELPSPSLRRAATLDATNVISNIINIEPKDKIKFGKPCYQAFGLTIFEAKEHQLSTILLKRGCDIPLSVFDINKS